MDISGIFVSILEFFNSIVHSYGVSIFLLVLTVKVVLLPLTIVSQRSMMKTQKIQPELKEINKKYKDNSELRGKKIMELYAEHNLSAFSPFLSCLSMIISLPFIIALFKLLQHYFNDFSAQGVPIRFLWIADISANHQIMLVMAVVLIYAISMYFTPRLTNATQLPHMKYLAIFLGLFIGSMTYSYPASLGIYLFSFSLFGILEQILVKKVFLKKYTDIIEHSNNDKKKNAKK